LITSDIATSHIAQTGEIYKINDPAKKNIIECEMISHFSIVRR